MGSQDSSSSPLHVVMFPWFGFGHISPFVQLSNKLSYHGVQISFFSAPGNIQRISSSLISSPLIKIIPLQIPTVDGLPPGLDSTADMSPALGELLKKALDQMQPQIKSILTNLKPHIVFFDFAQQWLPSIASPLGIKTLFFSVFAAVSSAILTVPARLESINGESPTVEDMKKPPPGFPLTSISSLKTYQARDFLYVFKSFHGGACVYNRVVSCMKSCDAIVIKSCAEMEGPYIDFVKTQYEKPVLLAGPVVPEPPKDQLEEKWAKWLGTFPSKSVVFCSFGSETFLKDEQIKELVLGLELSGLPFFVVLNFPAGEDSKEKLKSALPEGFEERVKGKGVVHTGWVQQQLILAHDSVGCFVCHSGLSSVTEGLMNDCQLVLLPLKGDQFVNAMLVSGDLKAGVEVIREDEDGYFGKEDLCKAVKTVMVDVNEEPGKSIRANQGKWRDFLLDKEVHERFISDFVMELKKMVI
ncbi:UDP-glucuronosyl/UDP-glucosyltransferase [Macleaya cordata]|uniref:Glycosyltransferase n=1 Tax=Macleaya cordata TaxID=56857 RepID=A0A200Q5K1_MACCD|nr:UDP-glucuronosyl/UDP-glucosyltransferase [Macleaya cordata]